MSGSGHLAGTGIEKSATTTRSPRSDPPPGCRTRTRASPPWGALAEQPSAAWARETAHTRASAWAHRGMSRAIGVTVSSKPSHRRERFSTLSSPTANLVRIAVAFALSLFSLPLLATAASAAPSSIVIDGNQDGVSDDWQGLSGTPRDSHFKLIADPVGNADTTTFNNSESDYPDWQAGSDGTASGKSDIGNVYVYDYRAARRSHCGAGMGPRRRHRHRPLLHRAQPEARPGPCATTGSVGDRG